MTPKVAVIGTGGTIASRYDPALGRKIAVRSGEELLRMLPDLGGVAEIAVDDFVTMGSFQMTAAVAFGLAQRIDEWVRRPGVAGVVVTHGTDTMEETAYLADLVVAGDRPIVFTGAQRSSDEPDTDGPRNLMNAIRAAAAPATAGLGAVICFNDELHAARDVTKLHSSALQTFQSPDHGRLGVVDGERVVIDRRPPRRRHYPVTRLEERVDLVKLALGADARHLDASVAAGAMGIVLEAFGLGNATIAVVDGVRRAVSAGVPVVVTSRCLAGRARPVYGGGGGGRDLEDAGAIFAGDLRAVKARILLMVLLADGPTLPELKARLATFAD